MKPRGLLLQIILGGRPYAVRITGLSYEEATPLAAAFEAEVMEVEAASAGVPLVNRSPLTDALRAAARSSGVLSVVDTLYCDTPPMPTVYVRDGLVRLGEDPMSTDVVAYGLGQARCSIALELGVARALTAHGLSLIHGFAYTMGAGGVLVLGESGAGKTTLALAALRSGASLVSDDMLLFGEVGARRLVRRLRSDIYMRTGSLPVSEGAPWEGLLDPTETLSGTHWVLSRAAIMPQSMDSLEVDRIVVLSRGLRPQPGAESAGYHRLTAGQTLAHLLRSSNPLFLKNNMTQAHQALATLSSRVPGLAMGISPDIIAHPETVFREVDRALCGMT